MRSVAAVLYCLYCCAVLCWWCAGGFFWFGLDGGVPEDFLNLAWIVVCWRIFWVWPGFQTLEWRAPRSCALELGVGVKGRVQWPVLGARRREAIRIACGDTHTIVAPGGRGAVLFFPISNGWVQMLVPSALLLPFKYPAACGSGWTYSAASRR